MSTPSLVDSHCHLPLMARTRGAPKPAEAVAAAHAAGVRHMLCVAVDLNGFPTVHRLATTLPGVFATVGVHPNSSRGDEPTVAALVERAALPRVCAIGETGLDYFRSEGDLEWQRERFRVHIRAAREAGRPLVVHCREARDDVLAILAEERAGEVGGVMHCFVEDWPTAERAMALGFYISFSGIVTFANAGPLREVARRVPAERLLVETDSPYLTPVPHRGKPNQPAYVRHVAECVAELRGESLETLAACTTANFFRLFGVAPDSAAEGDPQRPLEVVDPGVEVG